MIPSIARAIVALRVYDVPFPCLLPLVTVLACAPATERARVEPSASQNGVGADAGGSGAAHPIEPDRPDVTNGTHLVDVGQLQLETGYQRVRVSSAQHSQGTPVTVRLGLSDSLELRVSSDGYVRQSDSAGHAGGMGNVQVGAKVRVVTGADGEPVLAFLPMVNLPVASASKGLGSGDPDYTLTLLTGTDLGANSHIDANYGVGAIGAGGGTHFVQHLVSVSASHNLTEHLSPYLEAYWFSSQAPHGGAVMAVDGGVIHTVSRGFALDGGVAVGLSAASPDLGVFGGVSMMLGDVRHARHSLARQRQLAHVRHTRSGAASQ
ncbi:MAG: transporter [Vicinamibacterales bacterium]